MRPLRALKALAAVTLAVPSAVKSAYVGGAFSLSGFAYELSLAWGHAWGYDYARLARLAFTNPVAGRALRLVAQTMAEAPLYVERREGDVWEALGTNERDRELALVERSGGTTREAAALRVVTALYCGGEVWVRKMAPATGANAGRASALRLLMPDEYQRTEYDETGEITGYTFQRRARAGRSRGGTFTLSVDECRHVRLPHPMDDERGLAVLAACAEQIEHFQKATAWNSAIASGGGRVKGYWSPKNLRDGETLTGEQVTAAQAWFDTADREASQNNRDIVTTGAFERVPGDVTPKDADWISGLGWDLRVIAATCGVSPVLIGDERAGSLTDAGVDSEVRALYLLTVLPLLSFWLAELSAFLLPDGVRFAVDHDQIPALSEDMDAKAERFGMLYEKKLFTREEARVALGYDAAPAPDMGAFAEPVAPGPVVPAPAAANGGDPEQRDEAPVAKYLASLPPEMWDPAELAAKIAA